MQYEDLSEAGAALRDAVAILREESQRVIKGHTDEATKAILKAEGSDLSTALTAASIFARLLG